MFHWMKLCQKVFHQLEQEKEICLGEQIKPASLYFVEALDGGDQKKKSRIQRWNFGTWDAPFRLNQNPLMKTNKKICRIQFRNEENAVVMDSWYDTFTKTYFLNQNRENKRVQKEIIKMFMQIQVISKPDKKWIGQYVISIKNGKAHLIGDGFRRMVSFLSLMNLILKLFQKIIYF